MLSLGVDLAGSSKRPTGMCLLDENLNAKTWIVYSDEEIIRAATELHPSVVAIDAPLSLPLGRSSLDDRTGPHFRECDMALRRLGIKFFPITLGPMRALTARGMQIKTDLEKRGYTVIEVYPGGAQDVLRIPRKSAGLEALQSGLEKLGIKLANSSAGPDELDAVTAAYVGLLYLSGEAIALGGKDGSIIMPKPPPEFLKERQERCRASKVRRRARPR
ncbi:MAG: DUF429 domain-containing protein [Thermofilaceae archaeon]